MKRSAILSLLAAVPLVATLAFAGHDGECGDHGPAGHEKGRHHGRHGDHGMFFKKHLDELDLTAEQQKKVDAIFESAKKDRESGRKEFRAEYKKLHELLEQDKPDQKAVFAQVDKIGEMKTEHHKEMLKTLLAVRAELTPEQRKKLAEMKSKRGEHHRRHHDHDKSKEESKPEEGA